MKKIRLILLCGLLVLAGCRYGSNKFKIEGNVNGYKNGYVYLQELTVENDGPVDSVKPDNDGQFTFKGQIEEPKFFTLYQTKNNFVTLLVSPGESIEVKAQDGKLSSTYVVNGSDGSSQLWDLNNNMNSTLASIDSLNVIYRKQMGKVNYDSLKNKLDSIFSILNKKQKERDIDFIHKNIESLSCIMALYQQYDPYNFVFDKEKDFAYFKLVDSSLTKKYPNNPYVKSFHGFIGDLQVSINKKKKNIVNGAMAPDIALPDPNGNIRKLSDTRGKIVLLDFWASWCPPCRKESPNLVANYKLYHRSGFEIFQVSLDKSKEAWVNAIKDDNLTWIQVSDLNYWNSVVVPLYNIEGIPVNFLLDKEGKIIARDLHGIALKDKLKEVFGY
jgi:peroxiredoxin